LGEHASKAGFARLGTATPALRRQKALRPISQRGFNRTGDRGFIDTVLAAGTTATPIGVRQRDDKMFGNPALALARIEEEKMTPYSAQDLAENWEFKILRLLTARYRDPARLQAVLEEEARAGWTLVEKFDHGRVRLKRPASAKSEDATLPFDARRTTLGPGPGYMIVLTFLGALALIATIFALTAVFHIDGAHF
jgi:hypothetical protein